MEEEISERRWYQADWLKVTLIGGAGYLLGSIFPAGYVNYLVRSTLFPETLVYQEPEFDVSLLNGAEEVTAKLLLSTLENNPSDFAAKFIDKPVRITGTIDWFMESDAGDKDATLTLDTGNRYDNVFLSFDDASDPKVIALDKGGSVTASCIVTGTTNSGVHMRHCRVENK